MPTENFGGQDEEKKKLEERERLLFEIEDLRRLHQEGKVSDDDFKKDEAELKRRIDSIDNQNQVSRRGYDPKKR